MAVFGTSLLAILLVTMACGAPAPAPTSAPAKPAAPAPTAAPAAPAATKAPAAAPTTAPATQPATDYPKQPITLIVPWAAGGDTDVPMRIAAEFVGKEIGQPIVVQNVTGAAGVTGTRQAKGARPDGYTLLSIHEHVTVNQGTGLADYGVEAYEPIADMMFSGEFLMTGASKPWNNFKELVEDAKKRPGEISEGMTFGSTAQMFAFMVMHRAGIKLKAVGYDGTAQRMTALLGGQIDLSASPLSSALEQWKAKKVKVLAYASEKRDPHLPDVMTFKEQGFDIVWGLNRGWVAPKGTPLPIILKIEQAIKKASENREYKKKIEDDLGSEVRFMPHDQYGKFLNDQKADLLRIIQETGMKAK